MAQQRCRFEIVPEAAAALLLRFSLGVLFFFAGLNKFLAPIGVFGVSQKILEGFQNTYLPTWLVSPYLYVLPFIEVSLGAVLIVGICTREALTLCGLLLLSLAFGMMVRQEAATVAYNLNFVLIAAVGLWFAAKDNSYSLDAILGRCRKRVEQKQ